MSGSGLLQYKLGCEAIRRETGSSARGSMFPIAVDGVVLIKQFPRGVRLAIRVNPHEPRQSVVEAGINSRAWVGLVIGLLTMAVILWNLVPHLRGAWAQ